MKVVGFSLQGLSISKKFALKYSSSDSVSDMKFVYQKSGQELSKRVICFLFLLELFSRCLIAILLNI